MVDVKDVNSPVHQLIWGRVKSGKTSYIASGPNPVVFACEEGTRTLKGLTTAVTVFPFNQEGVYITPKWQQASDFVYYLANGDHDFKTAGVDTVSALLRIAMRFINKDEEVRDEYRAPGTVDQRTWGRVGTLLSNFMEDLEAVCKTRGIHLIYTCQERVLNEEKAEMEGSYYVPDLPPSVRSLIVEKPDIISRTFKEEDDEGNLKYGQTFKHAEWPVGVRESLLQRAEKPMPATAYNVTIPKIAKRLGIKL
jgi:hypothetical protein